MESFVVQFWAHFSFWHTLMICQIALNTVQTLKVKLPGVVSSSGEVIAGVPQGGVILPTLFNVFVNDIDDCWLPWSYDCTQYELVPTGSDSHMQVKWVIWRPRRTLSCFDWKDLFHSLKYSNLLGDISAYFGYVLLEFSFCRLL